MSNWPGSYDSHMKFEQIYELYYQKVFRLCMGYFNDHESAKDITQETFIIVWQKLSDFRNQSALSTWVFRIATNNCLRQIEKKKRLPVGAMPPDVAEQPHLEIEQQVALLYTCIAELPEIDRIIISLELENLKQADIALITGLSETNIRVRLHRIKEKLSFKFRQYERAN